MLFTIAVEPGDEKHAFGVVVPDLPGCFSAGDTLEEAFENVKEAITLHLKGIEDDGEAIPAAKSLEEHRQNPEFEGWVWGAVEIDLTKVPSKAERINITLPGNIIRQIDDFVAEHPDYRSRSGFLARVSAEKLANR